MKASTAIVAAAAFFVGSLDSMDANAIDLTNYPGATWVFTGGGANPGFAIDGDPSSAWTASYNSHETGNLDFTATVTFPGPVLLESIAPKVYLQASSRSFQAGGSDQGRRVEAEILYKTFGGADFLRVPSPDAYERQEVNQNDGESVLSWDRTLIVDLNNVESLRLRMSVASYTNEANAADGRISLYEFPAAGVPEPSVLTLAALGGLGLLGIGLRRRRHTA